MMNNSNMMRVFGLTLLNTYYLNYYYLNVEIFKI
jgi:hypothetical protein